MALKKKYKIALGLLFSLVMILLLGSLIISRVISAKVVELLEQQNIENFTVTIEKTRFSLFDRSLVFKEVHFRPTDSSLSQLKNNTLGKDKLHDVYISRLKLRGIQVTPLIFSKELKINKLIIDDPIYKSIYNGMEQKDKEAERPIQTDSIYLKALKGFQLDLIKLTNFRIQMININNDIISFQNKPLSFEVSGFKLQEVGQHHFKPVPIKETLEITQIRVEFPKIKYDFSIDTLKYHFGDDHLQVSNLKYKPMVNKLTLSNAYIYNDEIYNVGIGSLKIFNLNLEQIFKNKGVFIDSIQVSKMHLDVYKDKRNPFNLNKRPKLPHHVLKNMEMPLMIQQIAIRDSRLIYEEKLENKGLLMKVTMEKLNSNIFNITSIKEFRNIPMKIDLNTQFMGKANLNIDMILPLADHEHTFFFSGYLGPSNMTYYDSAIIPALGLKILKGEIESLSFQASANNYISSGTMKMIYNDLEAEVFKQKGDEKNNFLSWSVNNLLHKSNPGQNGEIREATMKFERTIHKGFGNYLWKTLQNGIVNTIAPFGMTTEKLEAKNKRKLKRAQRRKNKEK